MKFNDEKTVLKSMMGILLVAGLLTSCAKELPEDVSDDIVETAHSMSLFKTSVELETVKEDGILALGSKDEVRDVVAINELNLRNVKFVSGPAKLAPFFKDLKLESSFPGEKFTVHFAFSSGSLIAYAEVKNQRLTLINEQLSESVKTSTGKMVNVYPIFQYSVDAFGALEKAENALGEQTRTVLFKPKAMDNATHIKIDPKAERRKNAGFRFDELDDVKVVFNKARLTKRLFKAKEIIKLFNYSTEIEASSTIGKDDFLRVAVLKELLVIQKPVKRSVLTEYEVGALEKTKKDPRISMCDKTIAQAAKIEVSNCVLRPKYSIALKHIKLKKKYDEGVLLAQMDSPVTISKFTTSKLVEIDLDARLQDATIGKDINNTDEILTSKERHYNLDAEYVYVPMTMGTPREVVAADPFYQGKEKIVKMRFAKDGLEIYELEKDDRFTDNDLNNTPVIKIPGKHIDYKCKENDDDECVGGDVEDTDKEWKDKRFFIPTLDKLSLLEINPLDVMTVEADSCLQKVETKLVGYTLKKGVLNIELEKTYKTSNSWSCIADNYFRDTENMTGFSQAGFKVRFFYSIVDLKKLASKGYKPVAYPIQDHDEFGFFKDKSEKLADDFDRQRKIQKYFLNRWNPAKKVVTYHLSDSFDRPKNKLIKDATYKAFEGMNRSLKMANAGIQLELKDPSGKRSGDLRNSMIVLIDDPLSNGLLGYAPTVTNPRTGEIIQGHVNMYSGVLTSIVRSNWEGMVDFTIKKAAEEKSLEKGLGLVEEKAPKNKLTDEQRKKLLKKLTDKGLINKIKGSKNGTSSLILGNLFDFTQIEGKALKLSKNTAKANHAMDRRLHERFVMSRDLDQANSELSEFEQRAHKNSKRLKHYADNNALSAEAYNIALTVKQLFPGIKDIKGVFKADGTLKRWKDLNKKQKKSATDIIVPYTYTATLVHEVGHGLGLRHNFTASADAENYWTEEEAKALGLAHAPAYSSVMDYAFDPLNESTMFGKYDIAALRFGYAREVKVKRNMSADGELPEDVKAEEFVKVKTNLVDLNEAIDAANTARAEEAGEDSHVTEGLAPYAFCTDSNAGLSAKCNRFDEGSTLVEVTNHYISKYDTYYKYRNFRDGRNTFQADGLGGYAVARYNEFNRIRGIFEEWEFFSTIFGADLMVQGCGDEELKLYPICKDINDKRDAVKIAADFFLRVLKTPDHLCAVAKVDAPTQVVELKKLAEIYDDLKYGIKHVTTSCFDDAVKEKLAEDQFVVVGEAGKFLNGFKDNSPTHIYSNDRAVRGVWIDKVMALKSLLQRDSGRGITESTHMAIVDHSGIAPKIGNFLRHLVLGDDLIEPVLFKRADGSLFEQDYSISIEEEVVGPQRSLGWLKSFFKMPTSGNSKLTEVLLNSVKTFGLTYGEGYGQDAHDIVNLVTIRKVNPGHLRDEEDLNLIKLQDTTYAASETNALAYIMTDSFKSLDYLKQVEPKTILSVVNSRQNPPIPDGLTPEQKVAMEIEMPLLEALLGAAQQGADLSLEFFTERFGEELGTKLHTTYGLKAEGIAEVIEIKKNLGGAPDMASEIEIELYGMDLDLLIDFTNGTLEKKTEQYEQIIPYMPTMVHFR